MPDVPIDGAKVSEETKADERDRELWQHPNAWEVDKRYAVARYDEARYKSALEELTFYRVALAAIILERDERRIEYDDRTRYTEQASRGTIEHVFDTALRRHVLYLRSHGERIEGTDVEHSGEKG